MFSFGLLCRTVIRQMLLLSLHEWLLEVVQDWLVRENLLTEVCRKMSTILSILTTILEQ